MMNKTTSAIAICLGLIVFFSAQAQAHFPWITPDNYTPETGDTAHVTVGWGHRFPLGKFLGKDDLESISMVGPDGRKLPLTAVSPLEFEAEEAVDSPGTYLVEAKRKTGFYTKTTEGGKRQSKEGLNNVIKCYRSHMSMKSILTVEGEQDVSAGNATGHPLEILLLKNPADLKAGGYLPVRLLLHGQPYKGKIFATYMGFSTEKDVYAYTSGTDYQGMGKIWILKPGIWLLKAEHKQPYPDQDVCDVESFIATLTLEVK
jgi:uncharacterized GH25 family protein